MKNRRLLSMIIMGAPAAAVIISCTGQNQKQPNIVILLADDMGWGDLNINSNPNVETPVLNRLAQQSMSFDRFYVCPLSAPTRAEMLTGRYFLRTGVSSVTQGYENMRTDEVTLAEILKEKGYKTGCFGKWHNGGYYQQHPNRQGFDEFTGFCMGHLGYYFDSPFLHNDEEIKSTGYTTDFFTEKALDFISTNSKDPFLCYIAYNVPHSPYMVPPKFFDKYREKGLDSLLSSVYGMVENMDENIGKVLARLEELKLKENTIVIFFSDNGPVGSRYNGNMKGRKGAVDEGGIRVPFYISWPGTINPGETTQLAQDIDILPTLLSMCKIDYKPEKLFDGVDISKAINGRHDTFKRYIYSRQANQRLNTCNASIRDDRFRLVRTTKDTLLYNMIEDPSQNSDISLDEKKIFSKMLSLLAAWEKDLVSNYRPVTTIEAGFPEEKSFTLPVQDATLSGKVRYSSIHPNQSYAEGWVNPGDSISWSLNINKGGVYKVELRYGCQPESTGSKFRLSTKEGKSDFAIEIPFDSQILPDLDYVKRTESVERTWNWMSAGEIVLNEGKENITLKLLDVSRNDAGLIKAVRFVRN